ncbi:MAG: acetylornithine deacetylase/succinyl-diaminopimelate desuccinylase-like protein [Cellvibrionaceae bacterium]|jgi:acetylornithine deacetylase/succinyl-diaminopimelate desuccinylase-like protein
MTPIEFARENQQKNLDELIDWLKIPSISTDMAYAADVAKAAGWLVDSMAVAGLENIQLIESELGLHPLVYADWLHAGADKPTVLIYGHFDVQPPDPLALWDTPPFEPTVRDNRLYARGASDDKGQTFIHVKAVEALLKADGTLPVNVKFICEGEEESGGRTLSAFLPENKELLKADVALVSDTGILSADQPSITYALRGIYMDFIDVTGPAIDLHSGMFGGGIDNPLNVLGHIIAGLKDLNGEVLIPGFYDDVRELSAEERALLAQLPFDEEKWLEHTGASRVWGESAYTLVERLGARPTLDVHGIIGGYTGEGGKTVLPSTVHAKISMRLVPDQDPAKIKNLFREHVLNLAPDTVTVKFGDDTDGSVPSITDYSIPPMKAAKKAYTAGFNKEPVFMREGGSIPVVAEFQAHLGLETVLMGFGLPTDALHSPNENFYLPNFYRGIETSIHFLVEYGKSGK